MFLLFLTFALMGFITGQYERPLELRPYPEIFFPYDLRLCTYNNISYEKCSHTVGVARNNAIPLAMECVRQDSCEDCINSVKRGFSDMVVLTGHGYKKARSAGIRPLIFAKESDESLYIAVAPRNITFIDVQRAPIYFNHSQDRAFHAATFFNLRMGHDICSFLNKVSLTPYIYIVDSADYVSNSEEILICPDRLPNEFENYKRCNIEASLQRAVFVRSGISWQQKRTVLKIFETIAHSFGATSETFKFFDTFQDHNDVIFKKNTISFDFVPTYRNSVDENVFNNLHCNKDDQSHDNRSLL